jgi:hypothetical protein
VTHVTRQSVIAVGEKYVQDPSTGKTVSPVTSVTDRDDQVTARPGDKVFLKACRVGEPETVIRQEQGKLTSLQRSLQKTPAEGTVKRN